MKIAYNWLKTYINISESPEEIAEWLTSTGLEVEHIDHYEQIRGSLDGLVVGEVITCIKHPNADKLSLTKVDIGTGKPASIVCGASNVATGQKVIVALPGTTLYPAGKESFKIDRAKIRGEISEGMICAEDEIGLGESHDGIIVLSTSAANGTAASKIYNVYTDYVFEIGLTPNRTDAFSHIGVARDIKALKGREINWPSVEGFNAKSNDRSFPVAVKDANACPRYSSLTISGVTVKESPDWLKQRLLSIGLTPINNVVDVTNFICHELGQPLHAFDADRVSGGRITVKTLPNGTPFVTLDGKTRNLSENDLMICDEKGGLCIAGVFGGARSGITKDTKTVFLESATFSPEYVRRTVLAHQLNTDASFRFARGTDPSITVYALKRAALLIEELSGGVVSSAISDIYPHPVTPRRLTVRDKHVDRLIGKPFPRSEVTSVLSRLDIEVLEEKADEYLLAIPTYRLDVEQEVDVVEEFLRIYGFNKIELEKHAHTDFIAAFPAISHQRVRQALGELLAGNGYFEIWTNSLGSEKLHQQFASALPGQPVGLLNKLSEDLGVMRQTMLFSMLEVCAYNLNRKQKNQKLFEFGKIYYKEGSNFVEQERLGVLLTGNREEPNWQRGDKVTGYYDVAQIVTQLLKRCGLRQIELASFQSELYNWGVTFMCDGHVACHIGRVNATVSHEFGLKQEIFHAEIDMSLLLNSANPKLVIQDVPKYPAVTRDLSLVLNKDVPFKDVLDVARQSGKSLVNDVGVFDVYEGKNIPDGKKAYAITITLLDPLKTLTEAEIDEVMQQLMKEFEEKLGAVIRR